MLNLTTPSEIDEAVSAFCSEISSIDPVFLALENAKGGKLSDCFNNVANHVDANGGCIQHGWIIWYAKEQFIEAEFHAAWADPEGTLHDITPKKDGEKRILFLPDESLTWNRRPVPNKRKALCDDPLFDLMIQQGQEMDKINRKYANENGEPRIPGDVFMAHQRKFANKAMSMMQTAGRQENPPNLSNNRKCECGSGRKYKHCGMKGLCRKQNAK